MAERIRAGRISYYAAFDGEKLAAFGWYALESIEAEHTDGVAVSYPSDVAFMYSVHSPGLSRRVRAWSGNGESALRGKEA